MNEPTCNVCGKVLDIFDRQCNFRLVTQISYGSIHDGESCDIRMCCKCFDRIVSGIPFAIDPFYLQEAEVQK